MPIRVRWNEALGKWVVITGERRYRAALQAGSRTVACILADGGVTSSGGITYTPQPIPQRITLGPGEAATRRGTNS
jgi:hypothetical protein